MIVVVLCFNILFAAALIPVPTIKHLPLVGVNAMIQDREGYVWYATHEGGLCRDNGYQVDVFRNDRKNPMCLGHSNGVLSICETSKGDICFGTRENIYLLKKKDYSIIPLDSTVKRGKVRLISRTAYGGLVAFTASGVCYYDKDYRPVKRVPQTLSEDQLKDSVSLRYSHFVDWRNRTWKLIDRRPFISLSSNSPWHRTTQNSVDKNFFRQCRTINGNIFKGDSAGISIYSPAGRLIKRIDGLSNVRQIIAATPSTGSGTAKGGAYYVSAHAQLAYCSESGKVTILQKGGESKTLACTSDGTVWAAGWQGQVWRYDTKLQKLVLDESASTRSNDPVNRLAASDYGLLWILTDKEIKAYNPKTHKCRIIRNTNPSVNIEQFKEIIYRQGKIIVYGSDGTLEIDTKPFSLSHKSKALTLTNIEIDGQNQIVLPDMKSVDVNSDATIVILYFSTFDHLNACDIQMSYRINKGNWIKLPLGSNSIQLSALSKGAYNIEVRAQMLLDGT